MSNFQILTNGHSNHPIGHFIDLDGAFDKSRRYRIAMMCAERDPLDCHRYFFLSHALLERSVSISHVMTSGEIATHRAMEDRLLESEGLAREDVFLREQRLADTHHVRSIHRSLARGAE